MFLIRKALLSLSVLALVCIALFASMIRCDIPVEELKKKYADGSSRFIVIDDLPVHYRDEGHGVPILLLHGASSSLQAWDAWARVLSTEFRVIRLDLPGYGLTGPNATGDYSVRWYVQFLRSFLDTIGVKECAVAGNSFGGLIAIEFASKEQARVKKLILLDSSGYPSEGQEPAVVKMARNPVLKYVLRYVTPRFLVSRSVKPFYAHPEGVSEDTIDRYYQLLLRDGNRDTFISKCNRQGGDPPPSFKSITAPTLVLWGRRDIMIPVEQAGYFKRDIPHAEVIIYDEAGHFPHEEQPERTVADVTRFLRDK